MELYRAFLSKPEATHRGAVLLSGHEMLVPLPVAEEMLNNDGAGIGAHPDAGVVTITTSTDAEARAMGRI